MKRHYEAFTLLELLIVLIIVGIFFSISYPVMESRLGGIKSGGPVARTIYTLKYFLKNKDGKFGKRKIFIKFDIPGNKMQVYFKKIYKLKRFKKYRYNLLKYNNIKLEKIVSAGKTIKSGVFFMEISSSYVSPPVKLYFKENEKNRTVFIDTYYE